MKETVYFCIAFEKNVVFLILLGLVFYKGIKILSGFHK